MGAAHVPTALFREEVMTEGNCVHSELDELHPAQADNEKRATAAARKPAPNEIAIRCPETGDVLTTGIGCDYFTFIRLPFVVSSASCPHCGKLHVWTKEEAWLT